MPCTLTDSSARRAKNRQVPHDPRNRRFAVHPPGRQLSLRPLGAAHRAGGLRGRGGDAGHRQGRHRGGGGPCRPPHGLRRSVEARRHGTEASFTIDDTFEYDSPQDFETAIIVYGEAARTAEDAIEIRRWTGDRAIVRVETSAPWAFSCETLDAEPNSPRYPRPARIAIRFAAPAASGFVRVTFSSRS